MPAKYPHRLIPAALKKTLKPGNININIIDSRECDCWTAPLSV